MVLTVHEELHSFNGLVPLAWIPFAVFVVFHDGGTNEGFTDVCNALIAQIVGEFEPIVLALVHAFAFDKLQAFRVPSTTTSVSTFSPEQV